MIHFFMHVFKWPQCHSIYWALEDERAVEQVLGQPVAYCHVTRDANCIIDNIVKWALDVKMYSSDVSLLQQY